MRSIFIFSLLFVCGLWSTYNCTVEQLTDNNFDDQLKKHKNMFVKFYAPWCGHCKRLAPSWVELSNNVPEDLVVVGDVDCTSSGKETCAKFNVQGYPTLIFIKYDPDGILGDKAVIKYERARDLDAMLEFALLHGSELYKTLEEKQVEEFMNDESTASFVLFTESKNTKAFKEFLKIIQDFMGIGKFAVHFSKTPKSVEPETVVFTRAKSLNSKFEKETDSTQIVNLFDKFIKENIHGKVAFKTQMNEKTISRPLLTLFIDSNMKTNASLFKMIRHRLLSLPQTSKPIQLAIAQKDEFGGYFYSIGQENNKNELFFTIDDEKNQKFVPSTSYKFDQISTIQDNIGEFIEEYFKDNLEAFLKSEEVLKDQDPSKPFILAAKSFIPQVIDSDKDYFIKMYAPWCGHCKKLVPIWEELAKEYKNVDDLVIAKFDVTANDIPLDEFQVEGFPTLFYVKKNDKHKPINYNGARTTRAFNDFIKSHYTGSATFEKKDEL